MGSAPSTQRTYGAGMKHFTKFCLTYSITDPFLLSELLLCYYTSYLVRKGLAPQMINAYLAALRNAQISLGLPDPREQSSLALLKRVQAGIGRIRLGLGASARGTTYYQTLLAWGDVAVDSLTSPSMVQVHLKKSETDSQGRGADVIVGVTGASVCLVAAMCQYLRARGSAAGPFFITRTGSVLTKPRFVAVSGPPCSPIRGTQLQDRSGNSSGTCRHGGLHDPNLREMEQYCLPKLHQDSKVAPGKHVSSPNAAAGKGMRMD